MANKDSSGTKRRGGPSGPGKQKRRRLGSLQQDIDEIKSLEARIAAGAPAPGSNPLGAGPQTGSGKLESGAEQGEKVAAKKSKDGKNAEELQPYSGVKLFSELPLSDRTKRALKEAKYVTMTAIQRAALPHALCGRDVLGAAKTGSGKTLAFVIPVLEKLFRARWSPSDGVGAIIISPTRELATQIFNEVKRAGKHHALSGGLLIGGHGEVDAEKERVGSLNVLVATPGRLLQHMDETPSFDCSQLQVLVLDEADRILDLGFAASVNAILANLPRQRQTMLFSATQTKSVRDLARLSLRDPEYLAVHAEARAATPQRLQQSVMSVPLPRKLDVLWSFLRTHLNSKTLVFLSSCKQVKYVYEAFKRLRPGVPLKCLHGRMKQMPRLATFYEFCETQHAVLFATDVAARGLDFPHLDWVLQVDCPDDVASYIHRVGRTARYTAAGRSLLLLEPSERAFLPALQAAKIPFKTIKANPQKMQELAPALAGLLSKDADLKYMAQRAFVTYLRSIHLQSNKEVFNVSRLAHAEYAQSLGLAIPPKIRFLKKGQKKLAEDEAAKSMAAGEEAAPRKILREVKAKEMERHEPGRVEEGEAAKHLHQEEEEEDVFMKLKRVDHRLDGENEGLTAVTPAMREMGKKRKKLKIGESKAINSRLRFDEEGRALPPLATLGTADERNSGMSETLDERYGRLRQEMRLRDREDRQLEKLRLREKRQKERGKAKVRTGDLPSLDATVAALGGVGGNGAENSAGEEPSSDDGDPPGDSTPGRVSYAQQGAVDREGDDAEKNSQRRRKGQGLLGNRSALTTMTVAEQEALALRLLSQRN